MAVLRLEIVTPEARIYSDTVDSVALSAWEGEIEVLPMHIPLMTMLTPGELRYKKEGRTTALAIGEGFVEVVDDKVVVLTDMAVREQDINEDEVQAALERAQKALTSAIPSDDAETYRTLIKKSLAQLDLKHRRRKTT